MRKSSRALVVGLGLIVCSTVFVNGAFGAADDMAGFKAKSVNLRALRMAIEDLNETYGTEYRNGNIYLHRLENLEKAVSRGQAFPELEQRAMALQRDALLANPVIDFDKILLVRRSATSPKLGLIQNWQGNCSMEKSGFDDQIAIMPVKPDGELTTLYKPGGLFVGDVELHYDADKLLFSMIGLHNRWQIWEIDIDGTGLRQVTPGQHNDVDNYDACYLPDERIIFASTRCFVGVPCVSGKDIVANLCIMGPDGGNIRELCFDQDHNWCPTVLNNGRVLYTRWEYSDTAHYFSRLLFHMNPDGTSQTEYYGSNSYWPNSMFYARPIPGHPTQVVAIVSGHHGVARMGEMVIFDPAKGRHEADGVVQRIPGYGEKVEPIIADQLVDNSWPKFLHPYPLSEKYFLVSSKPTPSSEWGIYLVDIFDNMLLLKEEPGYVMFEPIPLRKTKRQAVVPDRVDLSRRDAIVYLSDIYFGQGLKDVPRGEVKNLRLYSFHFAYPKMGGHQRVGIEGTWDVHRILGTVPVEADGSAMFRVPANMPIAVQPLDSQGQAMQIMRSWFTAMPGETVSCVGCHERQNATAPQRYTAASRREPSEIKPWYGLARGFSFVRDVQPVLDKYCVGCHNGVNEKIPDFARKDQKGWRNFTESYLALHPFVRRPGPESNYHVEVPMEYHASTSELVQMLKKGHKGVKIDAEAWDRLYTWIDLNTPDHGTWSEHRKIASNFRERRQQMQKLYATAYEDPELIPSLATGPCDFVMPEPEPRKLTDVRVSGWPFDASRSGQLQQQAGTRSVQSIDLGSGVRMDMTLVPAGSFVMGSDSGYPDESPRCSVAIDEPFWMGQCEVTQGQFNLFDSRHSNGYIDRQRKDQSTPGYPVHSSDHPVIRVSWDQAMEFCRWLSEKTGRQFSLPSESQWEWACRAGSDTALSYGGMDADFGSYANLADVSIKQLVIKKNSKYDDWVPRDGRFDDGQMIMSTVGQYQPNAWGLKDMHGNVSEWTLSSFASYPYNADDGRNDVSTRVDKVVRGGSWHDRPSRARSAIRFAYTPWQKVFNVGFRVVCRANGSALTPVAAK